MQHRKSKGALKHIALIASRIYHFFYDVKKVKLEESVKTSNEEPPPNESRSSTPPTTTPPTYSSTPSSNVARATSAGSRADYSCYTIRGNDNDILAVVIETIAQVYLTLVFIYLLYGSKNFSSVPEGTVS